MTFGPGHGARRGTGRLANLGRVAGMVLALMMLPLVAEAQIPEGAARWRKVIIAEWRYQFGLTADTSVPFAQIAQESGWNESARSRVGALGLSQFLPSTAAGYQRNVTRLQELCSAKGGCALEPRWAIRAMTTYDHDEWVWASSANGDSRLAFMLASYNGGRTALLREITLCKTGAQCNAARWSDVAVMRSRSPEAWAENRGYPRAILERWRPIYARWLLS